MLRGNAKFARALRRCRECGSRALAGPFAEELDDDTVEMSVRCGECGTWRSSVLPAYRADAVGRRVMRAARHGRRDIEDALRRLRMGGIDSSDIGRAAGTRPTT
jgi:DNA-directed RNA polymerase subunit RPC12/RpoP